MSVITALRRLRQEDGNFEASLIVRPYLKTNKQQKRKLLKGMCLILIGHILMRSF
jgi:hypothetical protein